MTTTTSYGTWVTLLQGGSYEESEAAFAAVGVDLGERVNAVLPDAAAALAHALALARTIAAKSPLAIAGTKLAINHARDHSTASALQHMTLLQSAIFDTGEMATAIAAWKDKREAEFAALAPVAKV